MIGSGPDPCTSALQALEFVCDQIIDKGSMPPGELIRTLLSECENLAMISLAYGTMVRHLEHFDGIIDGFLTEPYLWEMESDRATHERFELVGGSATVAAAERRKWNPRQTVARLLWGMDADTNRVQELKSLGCLYFERAKRELEASTDSTERLAVARRNALAFDRGGYEVTRSGNQLLVKERIEPEVQAVLADSTKDDLRVLEAYRLQARYAERSDHIANPDPPDGQELQRDIATAKTLIADPPPYGLLDREAPTAAVAAATLEAHFLDGMPIAIDDLSWAAHTLATIVRGHIDSQGERPQDSSDTLAPFWKGAERSAARGLPLLLQMNARTGEVLERLRSEGLNEQAIKQVILWIFTRARPETRYAASRALDSIWHSPCNPPRECLHRQAFNLVEQSLRHRAIRRQLGSRPGYPKQQNMPEPSPPTGPLYDILEAASCDDLVAHSLNPALRALGSEALSRTCIHDEATGLLEAVLRAHRRARCGSDSGNRYTRQDALFAARAVLQRTVAGNDSALWEHIAGFARHYDGLWECLMALAAAAEESPEVAAAAHDAWPWVIREGLRILTQNNRSDSTPSGDQERAMVFSSLLPSPPPKTFYMHREIPDGPMPWINPESWMAEIDLWVAAATGTTDNTDGSTRPLRKTFHRPPPADGMFGSIGALIGMLSVLPSEKQVGVGIRWVERLAVSAGDSAARTWSLPDWLRNVQPHCEPHELQVWQSIVDHLLVHGDRRVSDLAD